MKLTHKLSILAEVTSTQWGMITTAQAKELGVSRLDLARMADAGHLERLAHGVYRDTGTPEDQWTGLRAAWLSTNPQEIAERRTNRREVPDVTVARESAAQLHGIGDHRALRHEFVTAKRRQTQRDDIRYRQRDLDSADITLAEGLPVMTMERTIVDLVESNVDGSLVSDTLRDASEQRDLDRHRLQELLAPLAARNGLPAGGGAALYEKLAVTAGVDGRSQARRIARTGEVARLVSQEYLRNMPRTSALEMAAEAAQEMIMESIGGHLGHLMKGGAGGRMPRHVAADLALYKPFAAIAASYEASLREVLAPALDKLSLAQPGVSLDLEHLKPALVQFSLAIEGATADVDILGAGRALAEAFEGIEAPSKGDAAEQGDQREAARGE